MAGATPPDQTGQLQFDTDTGASRSKWIAGLLAIVLVGWMGSGAIIPSVGAGDGAVAETPDRAVSVAVIDSVAQDVPLVLTAEGQSIPDRAVTLRAKADGEIASVAASRGDLLQAGQEIARIDAGIAEAQLVQAQTQLAQAQRDYDNALALQDRGAATEDRVSQARAARAAAEAGVTSAQDQLDNTIVTAPFAGRLNDLTVDIGESVENGMIIAEVLDNDPLTVVVQVPQQALSRLQTGQEAQVSFITGEEKAGTIAFIGANADQQTRTFRVEVVVDNPDSVMPAGLSARVAIPTGQARGHFLSPAVLSLGTNGELGIKTVDADNRVVFSTVQIVRAQTDGIWIAGLPEQARIITVGQGFVNQGDPVEPRAPSQDQTALVQP
ncbi:efflux RND transporter periplasmic adaptor subunit [Yoonia vestfoldensis]|uniref:Multidrug resistance protein MdtA n=1 Tax=Yoonia vestfoldensis TaxID=245188 RepID=A0A1Y0EEQ5_9RHOB|nr:efflux RND transporter periplasmic adaptor subunit [Yoonia vestfoldensis]ARU02116.1 multidrug resistance protein MdtA [Yoonia vestfoldensis]